MAELVLGIDEAGRGPILGPMVLAAVAVDAAAARRLRRLGVRDSKAFTGRGAHAERCDLADQIVRAASFVGIAVVDVEEIDRRCAEKGLNRLEQERAAELIGLAPACARILCDGERLFAPLRAQFTHLRSFNHGESRHVAIAAASIVAKARRDQLWHKIAARYRVQFGKLVDSGGGYVNAGTRKFLRRYIRVHGRLPPEGRRSWPWDFAADLLPTSERLRDR